MPRVTFVAGARHNENIGAHSADMRDNLVDDARGMDGDDNAGGSGEAAGLQKTRIGRIAIKHVVTIATVTRDGGGVRVGDDVGNAVLAQQCAHNLSDTTVADNDCMPL